MTVARTKAGIARLAGAANSSDDSALTVVHTQGGHRGTMNSTLSSPAAFLCLVLGVACSETEVGTTTRAICNCYVEHPPCCCASPILLDIAGDGFALTSAEDGVKVATRPGSERSERAWTKEGSDDAWLVLDRNEDGVI